MSQTPDVPYGTAPSGSHDDPGAGPATTGSTGGTGGTGRTGSTGSTGSTGETVAGGEAGAALRAALRRAVRLATTVCLLAAVVTAGVAYLVVGLPGVWGALVGFAIALAFLATTALVGARTAGGDPVVVAGWLLGSWLVKVVVVGVVLFALREATFYDPVALFVGIVVGMLCTLFAEFRALTTARVPYVDTSGR